jgi:4-diphosphocytidyl-2-C-methyl-D-erythritol kinase
MVVVRETAFAKINLALHVRGRRDDGYHALDTLFAFVDDGDHLTGTFAEKSALHVEGPFAGELGIASDNLITKTVKLLSQAYEIKQSISITLDKRLPVASGIGGGSADAAAAARIVNILCGLQASDAALAAVLAPLGADIPACIASRSVRGQGTGTALTCVDDTATSFPVLLVNPNKALSTSAVFAAWNGTDQGGLPAGNTLEMALNGRNDLQEAAAGLCPDIKDVLTSLNASAPLLVRMSGSGATCFALYSSITERDSAQRSIARKYPHWWTMTGRLR